MSTKEILEYGFQSEEQFFDYIIESYINGQFTQLRELYGKLDYHQTIDFHSHLIAYDYDLIVDLLKKL